MGLLFDLFRDTPANTLAADLAANRHAELVALSRELMSALRALQATLDRAAARPLTSAPQDRWQSWPGQLYGTDSCENG